MVLNPHVGGDTNGDGNATSPGAGDWFRFSGGEPVIEFDHVQFRYSNLGINLTFTGSPVTVTNSIFEYNFHAISTHPVAGIPATFRFENNTFRNNTYAFVFLSTFASGNLIKNNNFSGNQTYAAQNLSGTAAPIDMRNNWWGHASGPRHASNPLGQGDAITDGILFDPFLTSEVIIGPPSGKIKG